MENKNFTYYTALSLAEVYKDLDTHHNGLSAEEVKIRLQKWGLNEIKETDITWFHILKNQILSPFMCIFFAISIAYLCTSQWFEACLIFGMIVLNVGIGFYQEYQSNMSMQLLKKSLMSQVTVSRDGKELNIPINQLVVGDVMVLYAGDIIPADCRFIETDSLMIDESSLTGESIPVEKTSDALQEPSNDIYHAKNIGFTGTTIDQGKGIGVVIGTGALTALGKIASLTHAPSSKSCLEKGVTSIAKLTIYLIFFSLIITAMLRIIVHKGAISAIDLILFSAALAITAIPEGLPMVITFCLSKGAASLQKNNVIIKRLSAIGDLGSINVFCTDKTGTLTENALTVADIFSQDPDTTLLYAVLSSPVQGATKESSIKGFDLALHKLLTDDHIQKMNLYTRLKESPFTPQKRQCLALIENNAMHTLIIKGSPEIVLEKCTFLTPKEKESIDTWMEQEESKGNRILAVATKSISSYNHSSDEIEAHDNDYESIGLISFKDPLKKTALSTVEKAQSLGIQIKILSGDSKNVCFTIAKQLGLEDSIENVVLGEDFEKSSEEEKVFLVNNRSIFARVNPEQKYQIIDYLKKQYSVGYMGDGINDAPALKVAHVSFAVHDAAPVAREAAEIILLKKSLSSVILGIEEGRKTIVNTLKYTKMTNAPSFGHFYALAIASLLVKYPPMLPIQLLFLNLLTDVPMMAISTDTVSYEEIKSPITYDMTDATILIFLFGVIMFLADLTIFFAFKSHFPATLQTSWFITSTISEVIFIFLFRTQLLFFRAHKPSLLLITLSSIVVSIAIILPFTEFGQKVFLFSPPQLEHIPWLIGVIIFNMVLAETVKLAYYYIKQRVKHAYNR